MEDSKQQAAQSAVQATGPSAAPTGEKNLTNVELKKLKQAEKQAKRAATKKAEASAAVRPQQPAHTQGRNAEVSQRKPPKTASNSKPQQQGKAHQGGPSSSAAKSAGKPKENLHSGWPQEIAMFKHLSIQRRTAIDHASKDVHPAILAFGLQLSSYVICGSTARCLAMLQAFKAVIESYSIPPDVALARHFIPNCLSPQIEYIKSCRPLSVGMGNAIRFLKDCIVKVDPELAEREAKQQLLDQVDDFIRERITAASAIISREARKIIADGDVILTFAKSSLVERVLIQAHEDGKHIRVIVIDSKPLHEGKHLAQSLRAAGIEVDYYPITGIAHAITQARKVFLGAHAMLSDGRLFSRAGSAIVAMQAADHRLPVHVLCESFKFSEKILVDSLAQNEVAPAEELLETQEERDVWLKKIEQYPTLQVFNPMYDVTPVEYLEELVSEYGKLPPSAVPMLLNA
jgi:translation initiation factor eIF-2B subunit delta